MLYSTERILTTHAGSLPRPADLREMVVAKANGAPYDPAALERRLKSAVAEVVRQQVAMRSRLRQRRRTVEDQLYRLRALADRRLCRAAFRGPATAQHHGPRRDKIRRLLRGQSARTTGRSADDAGLRRKIALYRSGRSRRRYREPQGRARRSQVAEAFLPANTPGTIEHWLANEYYKSDEEFVFAIADVMHEEYQAIVDAGFLLQIDDPDLPDGWNCLPNITLPEYRKYAAIRVDALNHALAGIPQEKGPAACLLGQPSRPASRRHSAAGHHRPDLSRAGGQLLDRSLKPLPRA